MGNPSRSTKQRRRGHRALPATVALVAAVFGAALPAGAQTLAPEWKDGITFKSDDGNVKVSFGGRVLVDYVHGAGNKAYEGLLGTTLGATNGCAPTAGTSPCRFADDWRFRELRLQAEGELYENTDFKIQVDFAGGKVSIKDAWVTIKDIGDVVSIRGGHFKEPMSLEQLTSGRFVTMNSRSVMDTFAPGRNLGIQAYADKLLDGKMSFATGIFRETNNDTAQFPASTQTSDDEAYAWTSRLTFAPILENKGEELIHLGFAYSLRNPPCASSATAGCNTANQRVKFEAKPEIAESDALAATGNLNGVARDQRLGAELAAQFSSLALQGEYIGAFETMPGADRYFYGWYGQASYFLTGEYRPYSPGGFKRPKPLHNLGKDGWGAFELAGRVSHLNLVDDATAGGNMWNCTAGLNWYLNPNVVMKGDFVYSTLDKGAVKNANLKAAVIRLQADI